MRRMKRANEISPRITPADVMGLLVQLRQYDSIGAVQKLKVLSALNNLTLGEQLAEIVDWYFAEHCLKKGG